MKHTGWLSSARALTNPAALVAVTCLLLIGIQLSTKRVELVRAAQRSGPVIYLEQAQPLEVSYSGTAAAPPILVSGQAHPLALTSGDFHEDGILDLAVGYEIPGGGAIALHRGNLDAFAPQSHETFEAIAQGRFPPPFRRPSAAP